jgi:hypothetical protein
VLTAPPVLGQHTNSILEKDLGFSPSEMAGMRAASAI